MRPRMTTPISLFTYSASPKPLARRVLALCAVLGLLTAAACAPIKHSHGYTPRADELDRIKVGVDTRSSVQNKLGRPSTLGAFDDDDWIYISIKSETLAFFEPEVVDKRVVLVTFNTEGVVADIGNYGIEDGRVIDLVSRTTPTSGRKLTILQQVFQNVGRYGGNSNILDQIGSGRPGGPANRTP